MFSLFTIDYPVVGKRGATFYLKEKVLWDSASIGSAG